MLLVAFPWTAQRAGILPNLPHFFIQDPQQHGIKVSPGTDHRELRSSRLTLRSPDTMYLGSPMLSKKIIIVVEIGYLSQLSFQHESPAHNLVVWARYIREDQV